MKQALRFGFIGLLLAFASTSSAFDPPKLTGRVVDEAEILSPAAESRITQRLQAVEDATSNQLVVATVASLDGLDIRQYGIDLARAWELGQKDKDNGVLLLVAPAERKLAIEVGYGLEGDFPDVLGAHIINNEILPHFYAGRFEAGIEAGVAAITAVVGGEYEVKPVRSNRREVRKQYSWLLPVLWLPLLMVFFFGRLGRRRGAGSGIVTGVVAGALLSRSMGGGSSGFSGGFGGGFSGGGGSFGGGGASGGW